MVKKSAGTIVPADFWLIYPICLHCKIIGFLITNSPLRVCTALIHFSLLLIHLRKIDIKIQVKSE